MDQRKKQVFFETNVLLSELGFRATAVDMTRPWGGFFVVDENQASAFASHFFPDEKIEITTNEMKLSPKILLVAPGQKLSWQYHSRRAEVWRCIQGEVSVVTSDTDEEKNKQKLLANDFISLKQGERHRLIGESDWGIVAEIWMHTDPSHPSDEEDIVRLQDEYGR